MYQNNNTSVYVWFKMLSFIPNVQLCCRYPAYVFVSDTDIASSASVKTRYSKESLFGVIFDVMTLAESDYLVCTFSSQVSILTFDLYHVRMPWFLRGKQTLQMM